MTKPYARCLSLLTALVLGHPVTALAQFAVDSETPALRQALHRVALADLSEGDSILVAGALPACIRDRALFIADTPLSSNFPQTGENYRIRRLAENALAVETVTTDEALFPRLKMALSLALSASESDCARLSLPDSRLLRIATLDGASSASELLARMGDTAAADLQDPAPHTAAAPNTPPPEPPHGWHFSEEVAKGGVRVALVATLDPRPAAANGENPVIPRLKMRCENDAISFFVSADTAVWDERTEVTLRIDNGKVATYRWRTADDGTGVGLWSTAEAVPFLKKLPDNAGLFLRLRDRNLIYAEFDLANISQSLQRIEKACE